MASYSAAKIVRYLSYTHENDMATLVMMEQSDQEFSRQFESDIHIQRIFLKQSKHVISRSSKDSIPHLRSTIATITRALKNRVRFAIRQKERLKEHLNLSRPPSLNQRVAREVTREVDRELGRVINMSIHFEEDDEELQNLVDEAREWIRDDINTESPIVIINE
jgi:hypothetical protein